MYLVVDSYVKNKKFGKKFNLKGEPDENFEYRQK